MSNLIKSIINKIEEVYDIDVDIDNLINVTKQENTEKAMEELRPLVNEEFYNVFKIGIETRQSMLLKGEDLNRLSNKLDTMVYLALEYDLPLLVSTKRYVDIIKDKYGHTNLEVYTSFSKIDVDSDIILLCHGLLEKDKEVNGDKIYVGIKM